MSIKKKEIAIFLGKEAGETAAPKPTEKVAASRQDVYAGMYVCGAGEGLGRVLL